MKTRLEKFDVCEDCFSISIIDANCKCAYGKYKTISLEFEVCDCCGHILHDGEPAETDFNNNQLIKFKNEKI